jgi:hypothetical protein
MCFLEALFFKQTIIIIMKERLNKKIKKNNELVIFMNLYEKYIKK